MENTFNKKDKTNVMRLLDEWGIEYTPLSYDTEKYTAARIAEAYGMDPESVFKTLVTVGKTGNNYVFMVPTSGELDLKKAAKAAGEKSIEMIPQKQLLPLTGYIHGGCSPIGMKKQFRTFIDETVILFDTVCFSAGKVGFQVAMTPDSLLKSVKPELYDITK
jgi:Cys-tRNA(Pro)/Cys-tRNA(Cys) deacylase